MAGGVRVLGLFSAFALVAGGAGSTACNLVPASESPSGEVSTGGTAGTDSSGPPLSAGASTGGAAGAGTAGGAPFSFENIDFECQLPATMPQFETRVVAPEHPAQRQLFAWITDEAALAFRNDPALFDQPASADKGASSALDALKGIPPLEPETAQLTAALAVLFAAPRSAWPVPWANRFRWPGEELGHQLLHITLKPEAWVALVEHHSLRVVDLDDVEIPLATAAATPERIGAIYHFELDAGSNGFCSTFPGNQRSYRQFVVGNLAMVEQWSLQTQAIHDRLSSDIEQLTHYLARVRTCPVSGTPEMFNAGVACAWQSPLSFTPTDTSAYLRALSVPGSDYQITAGQLAKLIDTLRGDLLMPDPVVYQPGGTP